ncbi:protein PSK SIMULATOR 3-like [Cornus florida]|uniref:protein PSK SIMULATOR 3-like n=1 Tax=Cornus florida TaxID=4283 RepID=UPI00289B0F59|nr:protein PSK SIMULATOR 3-like [Cornus florida]XP_059667500.1 protein PSK SIMULATOR 3-like [Cornus florida]XP_059667501.1 protein PSK SIMULATOR 3-like [Cornus florida]
MGGETLIDSWFSNLWKTSRKSRVSEPPRDVIGILAFEVVTLMSKVVHLWQCLSDKQIVGLRENIVNSLGIQKLVSDDDDYLMDLALAEIIDNLRCVAKAVARLGNRCVDPVYHHFEHAFDDPFKIDLNWCGWEYRLKKMERKVRKMERFVAVTAQLCQEMEVLAEVEQSLRRMQGNVNLSQVKLLEFHQKVMWQQQEVKHLREMSPWVRTYDYTVRLLLRSLFTIISRIKHVFGINQMASVEENSNPEGINADCLLRSHSISTLMQSLVHPSDNNPDGFFSGRLGRSVSNLGLTTDKIRTNNKQSQSCHLSSTLCGKSSQLKTRQLVRSGPFKGCILGGSDSHVVKSCVSTSSGSLRSSGVFSNGIDRTKDANMDSLSYSSIFHAKVFIVNSKRKLLNAPASTLGYAGLALHYANVIILIEKLASAPHLICLDARDDLYNMLPTSVRTSLRVKLKLFAKTSASSVHDAALAAEWSLALARILEWLAPLAHNMIRWHSERNFEKQHMVSGMNVLLVQTLYFANQPKTEAAITELIMGLNYLSRFGRELNEKVFLESACSRACDDFLLQRDNITCGV